MATPHGCKRRGLNTTELEDIRRAPASLRDRSGQSVRAGLYFPPDAIEQLCAGCTPTWSGDRWQHDCGCLFRARPL